MDINKMLTELREERERIDEAILTLERLARSRGQRRGRPPAWLKEVLDSELDIGAEQEPNAVVHTERRGRGRPRTSKEQFPLPVEVGRHSAENLSEIASDLSPRS